MAQISLNRSSDCYGTEASLSAVPQFKQKWFASHNQIICDTCPNFTIVPIKSDFFKLLTTSINGCNNIDSIYVNVRPDLVPQLQIAGDSLICFNQNATLYPIVTDYDTLCKGKISLQWIFDNGTLDTNIVVSKGYTNTNGGEYPVYLKINNVYQTSKIIKVKPYELCINTIFIPNTFTPNNDGQNDVLFVRGTNVKSINFRLFNRWGEEIFKSTDLNNGWDGKYKGEKLPQQVVVFTLDAEYNTGEKVKKEGNVTILD